MLPMLVPMLTNVIGGLVADAATNLAKEHVEDMVKNVIPPEAMDMVDQLIHADPSQPCTGMIDMITRMADPDDMEVPMMPPMPSMENMSGMCSDMMSGALADESIHWANSMMDMAGTMDAAMMSACTAMDSTMTGCGEQEMTLTIRHNCDGNVWSFEEHHHPHD